MNFSTENTSGDWMQFQIIVRVKEPNKICNVILDNMVVFLYDEISQNIDNNVKSRIYNLYQSGYNTADKGNCKEFARDVFNKLFASFSGLIVSSNVIDLNIFELFLVAGEYT